MQRTYKAILILVAALTASTARASVVATFDDLHIWGTGDNLSAFVVDWNDGKSDFSLAWGFRWNDGDSTPTVADMVLALATSDPGLFMRFDSDTGFGAFIFGLGYQTGGDPFDVTGTVDDAGDPVLSDFVSGAWDINTGSYWEEPAAFDGAPVNAGDHYVEGYDWFFLLGNAVDEHELGWGYNQAEPSASFPVFWGHSAYGISDMELIDEGWYAFSVSGDPRSAMAAIPEPTSAALWLAGGGVMLLLRRRLRRHDPGR